MAGSGIAGGFDVDAFFAALDAERERRGLTWAALTRELNAPFAHRADIPPISASTLTGMTKRGALNANIVVHTLMWLGRTPEDFTPGHPVAPRPLPKMGPGLLPRWDGNALFAALDAERTSRSLTWTDAAEEIGGYTPSMVKGVRHGVAFPGVMRLLAWIDRPAADFVVNVTV